MCAKCLKQTDHHSETETFDIGEILFKNQTRNPKPVDKLKNQNLLGELKSQAHIQLWMNLFHSKLFVNLYKTLSG